MKISIELIPRFINMVRLFFKQLPLYGFQVAFWTFIFPFIRINSLKPYFAMQKHRSILIYLSKRYSGVIKRFVEKNSVPESAIDPDSAIWICWWDGEETMPLLVKACFRTIQQHAGTHPVTFITKFNYMNYISIPEYILEKLNAGIITVTHFSNMLRASLLFEYGGIWIDTTILTLQEICFNNIPFHTLKAPAKNSTSVTLTRYEGLSKNEKYIPNPDTDPQISRWSGFLLAGAKGNIIFDYMKEILYAYWKDHNDQIEYLLFDYTIALGYDNIPFMKTMIDSVPCSSVEKFVMEKNLNNEFSEEQFTRYCLTPFHKLTWKKEFNYYTEDHKLTLYGYLINNLSGNVT